MDGSEKDGNELREFDTIALEIKSIFKRFYFVVCIVELNKSQQVSLFGKNLVISQEVKQMLIGDTQIFLFISLLVVNNEIVEKYLIEFIEIFFKANPDLLLS